jgi:hypothetical protein
MNKMDKFNGALCLHSSPNPSERPSNQTLLILLVSALTFVAVYAVDRGGTFVADLTPHRFHVEVTGRPK